MKVSIVSLNNDERLSQLTDAILKISYDIKVSIFSKDYDKNKGQVKMTAQVQFAKDLNECIADADIVFNLISNSNVLPGLTSFNTKFPIDMAKALYVSDLVGYFPILRDLDELAELVKPLDIPIINVTNSPDVVTLYMYRKHKIMSFGLNLTADQVVPKLLQDIKLDLDISMLKPKLCGIDKLVWLTDLRDNKGRDLYSTMRGYTESIKVDVLREELSRQPLKSLAFYGYYHSGGIKEGDISYLASKLLGNLIKGANDVFYFNVINNGTIKDIGDDIPIVMPCRIDGKNIIRQEESIPLPLMLAMSDMVSSLSLIVSTMVSRDYKMFLRTIKLDSYLMSILTLEELDKLAKGIIQMYNLALVDKE